MALPIALLESVLLGLVAIPVAGAPTAILFGRRMSSEAVARRSSDYQAPHAPGCSASSLTTL